MAAANAFKKVRRGSWRTDCRDGRCCAQNSSSCSECVPIDMPRTRRKLLFSFRRHNRPPTGGVSILALASSSRVDIRVTSFVHRRRVRVASQARPRGVNRTFLSLPSRSLPYRAPVTPRAPASTASLAVRCPREGPRAALAVRW
jgi:hypothetical protein